MITIHTHWPIPVIPLTTSHLVAQPNTLAMAPLPSVLTPIAVDYVRTSVCAGAVNLTSFTVRL